MAMVSAHRDAVSWSARKRILLGLVAVPLVALVALAVAALAFSGVTLAGDPQALARVTVQPFGGTIERVQAFGPGGRRLALSIVGGRLTPLERLPPGEMVRVDVEVRRPGWLAWALGARRSEELQLRTPVAQVREQWMTVPGSSPVHVSFAEPVSAVSYEDAGARTHRTLSRPASSISLGTQRATGTVEIAAAARPWEKVGRPTQVSWFPPSSTPVMVSIPEAGARMSPSTPIDLTFSKTVGETLGSNRPRLSPSTPGHWREVNSHTLVFTPSGFGSALDSQLRVQLPRAVAVTTGTGSTLRTTSRLEWTVPPGSTLRLQQLLAQAGYLPLDWQPAGAAVARAPGAEAHAAVDPPSGSFSWRYPNTPHQLQAMWSPGQSGVITKGAVMKFENENALAVDGVAGPTVWRTLLGDAIAGKRLTSGYSYVYVHREVPEMMTLWHDGRTIVSSPANTGISGA